MGRRSGYGIRLADTLGPMTPRADPRAVVHGSESDDALAHACLAGDGEAWRELIRRYGAYIYAVAVRAYRLDPEAADEVFQDVCVRIYDGLAGYRGGGLRSWIRQVTISACREHFRQLGRAQRDAELTDGDGMPAEIRDLEAALDVRAAVVGLGDPCRSTIELAFFEDLTQAETARRLEIPEGTVAARISRCLRRLRDVIRPPGQGKGASRPSGEVR